MTFTILFRGSVYQYRCIHTNEITMLSPHICILCLDLGVHAIMRSRHGHLVLPQSIRFIPSPFPGPCGAQSRQRGWLPGPFLTHLPRALGWYMLSGSRQVTVSCTLPGGKKYTLVHLHTKNTPRLHGTPAAEQ